MSGSHLNVETKLQKDSKKSWHLADILYRPPDITGDEKAPMQICEDTRCPIKLSEPQSSETGFCTRPHPAAKLDMKLLWLPAGDASFSSFLQLSSNNRHIHWRRNQETSRRAETESCLCLATQPGNHWCFAAAPISLCICISAFVCAAIHLLATLDMHAY